MIRILLFKIIIFLIFIFTCTNPTEVRKTAENRINESAISEITTSFYKDDSIILGTLHRIDKNGYLPWSDSHGFTDISESEQLEADDLFAIGSITKTYTATIILQLMEEGKINIDSLAIKYVPNSFKAILDSMQYGPDVKVIHLLNHTSGIFSYTWIEQFFIDRYANLSQSISVYDIMNYVTEYGWFVNYPGTEYHYSNTNYVILGVIIEHITGKSYIDNLVERIFNPLNLSNTFLAEGMLGSYSQEIIHGYDVDYGRVTDIYELNFDASCWSAGGIISNTKDLSIFITALCKGELFALENTFQLMLELEDDNWYGLGIFVREHTDIGQYYGHGGGHQGTNSVMFYFPSIDCAYSSCITINGNGGYINPEDELADILEVLNE